MKQRYFISPLLLLAVFFISWSWQTGNWIAEKKEGYTLLYTAIDETNKKEYKKLIKKGIVSVKTFFNDSYNRDFNIFIHPDRRSLDSTWQKDWELPGFRSECWMVASGVAGRLDMLSPKIWDKESCEHSYAETKKTQDLITHELVHVFHGQQNLSPDFSNTEGIDWFVEGLATFASGQCDTSRISEVKKAIRNNSIPENLEGFWKGKMKYGLSGSVVLFIDHQYGRTKLTELLPLNNKSAILSTLNTTESALLEGWKSYIRDL